MEKKAVLLFFVCILVFSLFFRVRLSFLASAGSDVIWVPDDYPTIQAAINAANPGDTIKVRALTYYENVEVDKTIMLVGEGFPTINGISGGVWGQPVVSVTADNVTISGFVIQHQAAPNEIDYGVLLNSDGNNISGNVIRFNWEGIVVSFSSKNTISNNIIEHNYGGISCQGTENMFSGNILSSNGGGFGT